MIGGEELDELERRLTAALASPAAARASRRSLLRTLPRRTRLRLWCTKQVDGIAYWLVCHGRYDAATALWRLSGLWSAR